jgi:hypothetical protein
METKYEGLSAARWTMKLSFGRDDDFFEGEHLYRFLLFGMRC